MLAQRTVAELIQLIARGTRAGEPLGQTYLFEQLCLYIFTRTQSRVYLRRLQLSEGPNAERNFMGTFRARCTDQFAFRVYSELPPSIHTQRFTYFQPEKPNFPGIDAFMFSPLVAFQYTLNMRREVDGALFRSLTELLERTKYGEIYETTRTRAPLVYVLPDNKMLVFRLSGPADYLAKCTCAETSGASRKKKQKKQKREAGTETEDQSEKPWYLQKGPCVFCRCFKFFELFVMGIPGFHSKLAADEMLGASFGIELILDEDGKFVEVPQTVASNLSIPPPAQGAIGAR